MLSWRFYFRRQSRYLFVVKPKDFSTCGRWLFASLNQSSPKLKTKNLPVSRKAFHDFRVAFFRADLIIQIFHGLTSE
jgi:hypothetical protein